MASNSTITCDLAILGGGLAGGLIARALVARRPEIDVRIVESGAALGGNHVWSFFDGDIAECDRWLIEPLISHRWASYDVAFPAHRRTLPQGYNSIESERFADAMRETLGDRVIRGSVLEILPRTGRGPSEAGGGARRTVPDAAVPLPHASHVCPPPAGEEWAVRLADGPTIHAKAVIDARGPGDLATLDAGWQKFVGQLLRLERPHGLERPIVMDATVAQIDGYRFVYCLPFSATTVFVEDTYYSDDPDLDVGTIRERIAAYALAQGWSVAGVEREEAGVLPVVVKGDFPAYWASTGAETPKAGMRSAMFHPTTGYSLPDAVRLASAIAAAPDLSGPALARLTRHHASRRWGERGFYRLLDTMLFRAARPEERYRIMERFYRLSPDLVARFYAGRSTLADKLRILTGKPPIPIPRAVAAILKHAW